MSDPIRVSAATFSAVSATRRPKLGFATSSSNVFAVSDSAFS